MSMEARLPDYRSAPIDAQFNPYNEDHWRQHVERVNRLRHADRAAAAHVEGSTPAPGEGKLLHG